MHLIAIVRPVATSSSGTRQVQFRQQQLVVSNALDRSVNKVATISMDTLQSVLDLVL